MCACVERFGGLDIFISNAGIDNAGHLEQLSLDDFEGDMRSIIRLLIIYVPSMHQILESAVRVDLHTLARYSSNQLKNRLVGSKNNFAYAGSKFGGIGLTQRFCAERPSIKTKSMHLSR